MMMGRIRLAPGKPGFFDDLTGIHLSILKPEANVFKGMNTTNLKRGVSYGSIRLVYGTLDESSIDKPVSTPVENVVEIKPVIETEPEVKTKPEQKEVNTEKKSEQEEAKIEKEPEEEKSKEETKNDKSKTDTKKKNTSKAPKKEEKEEPVEE